MTFLGWSSWLFFSLWIAFVPASVPMAYRTFTEMRPVASQEAVLIVSLISGALALTSLWVRFRALPLPQNGRSLKLCSWVVCKGAGPWTSS